MSVIRRHWGFLLVLAVAVPCVAAFCWQDGVASVGDDSLSYLLLARHFAGDAGPLLAPWVPLHAHFSPLFPLLLASSGAASDLRLAHMLVGMTSIAALVAVYRHAILASASRAAGVLLVVLLLLAPGSWIAIKGILSEPLYLLVSLLALHHFTARLEGAPGSIEDWVAFGALLAVCYLTRAAAIALVAAYAAHALMRLLRGPRGRGMLLLAVPLAMVALTAVVWTALRPQMPLDGYRHTAGALLDAWRANPALMASNGAPFLLDGWIGGFTVEPGEGVAFIALAAVGALGVAGAALRAARNHLDGWYVLATLAMLLAWVFDANNMRRLLYPVLPLLLLHAAVALAALCRAAGHAAMASRAIAVGASLVALLCLPAAWLVAQKSRDVEPLLDAGGYAAADITEYYLTVDRLRARAIAAKHAAILTGMEFLNRATPPGARVMWVRPEYVALLGQRAGVPYEYRWDAATLAREASRARVDFIVVATLSKTDLAHQLGDPRAVGALAAPYAVPVVSVPNAVAGGEEFVLLRVDPERLERFVAR